MINNLPTNQNQTVDPTSDQTLSIFNSYYDIPVNVNQYDLNRLISFFEAKGFQTTASETLSASLAIQAKKEGYSIGQLLDQLTNLSDLEISNLLGEVLNFNRLNTSFIGAKTLQPPFDLVARNVLV